MRPDHRRGEPAEAGSCSKAIRGCPGNGCASTPCVGPSTNGKPPGGDPAAPVRRRSGRGAGSATAGAGPCSWVVEALLARVLASDGTIGAATPAAPAIAVAAVAPAHMITHVFPASTAEPAEHRKAPFLVLVEALVQGVGCVSQFLQCRTGIGHPSGPLSHALDHPAPRP